jgi:hypothetical protein
MGATSGAGTVNPSGAPVVRVTGSFVLCVMFFRSLVVLFLLAIVLSVFLRSTDSDYPIGISKLFFYHLLVSLHTNTLIV